ncbi:uncharacterized protein [Clytia hemisphaerica]|uniref:Cnidarian restricted protein n=1 Tax=Clytia hemisphaerica TaxID=252671 RepID=A0A7M5WRT3_9CNID
MKIWKALLLVSFLVYTVHCETEEETKGAEIAEDEPLQVEMSDEEANKLEDAPEEEQKDEEESDEEADEEEHEDEEEDSQDVEQQDSDEDASYRRRISRKVIFRFRNRRDQCRTSRRNLKCYTRRHCVRRDYRKRCLRVLVVRKCVVRFTVNCRICSQSYVRTCYRVRVKYGYGVKCYNSRNVTRCRRRNVRSYNRTLVVYKRYYNIRPKY